jgi:hypothetical protein
MSLTLTFTGNQSILTSEFFPPINLDSGNWTCGLLTFEAYNSIPNIDETNNKVYLLDDDVTIDFSGVGNTTDMLKRINDKLPADVTIEITFDKKVDNKSRVKVKCNKTLFVLKEDNTLYDLGFNVGRVLEANVMYESDRLFPYTLPGGKIILGQTITLAKGSYELSDIAKKMTKLGIDIQEQRNALTCTVNSTRKRLNFQSPNSIGSILGFKPRILDKDQVYESDSIVDIFKVNAISIECSIVTGSYINGRESHILHQFFPNVAPGYKIVEVPQTVVYLDILTKKLDSITVSVSDQEGRPVDLRGETVTVRIHLKRND